MISKEWRESKVKVEEFSFAQIPKSSRLLPNIHVLSSHSPVFGVSKSRNNFRPMGLLFPKLGQCFVFSLKGCPNFV